MMSHMRTCGTTFPISVFLFLYPLPPLNCPPCKSEPSGCASRVRIRGGVPSFLIFCNVQATSGGGGGFFGACGGGRGPGKKRLSGGGGEGWRSGEDGGRRGGEGCSCLYGNPCVDQYVCKDWANRMDVARKNGFKG